MKVQGEIFTIPANPAGGDIARGLRVKLTAGVAAVAGLADLDLGSTQLKYVSAGLGKTSFVSVLDRKASGTRMCVAAGAIAAGAEVHTAAAGKVNDVATATSFPYGIALTAAGADGDQIEVLTYGGKPVANV